MSRIKRLFSRDTHLSTSLSCLATALVFSTTSMALDPPSIAIDSIDPASPITLYTEGGALPDSINIGVTVSSSYGDDPGIGPGDNPVNILQVKLGVGGEISPVVSASTTDGTNDQTKTWLGTVDVVPAFTTPPYNTTIEAYGAIQLYYNPTQTTDGHQADMDSIAVTVTINALTDIDSSNDMDPMPDEDQWSTIATGSTLSTTGKSEGEVVTKVGNLGTSECYALTVNGQLLEVCIDASNTTLGDLQTALPGDGQVQDAIDGLFVLTVATASEDLNSDGYDLLDNSPIQSNDSDIYARVLLLLKPSTGVDNWEAMTATLPLSVALGYSVGGPGIINPNIMRAYSVSMDRSAGVNSTYAVNGATSSSDAFIYELGDSDGSGNDDPNLNPSDSHFYEGILTTVNVLLGFRIELGADTTSPIIYVTGDNPTWLLVGYDYVERYAIVYDEVDGTSVAQVLSNNVDTSLVGDYFVLYTAPADVAGNSVSVATRNVYVRDVLIPPDTGSGDGGGGGGCFIATAAYGTPMAQEIDTLRAVRDGFMLNNAIGTAFVDTYYRMSPPLADIVAAHPRLATAIRIVLSPVVLLSQWCLSSRLGFNALLFIPLLILGRIRRKSTRKKHVL